MFLSVRPQKHSALVERHLTPDPHPSDTDNHCSDPLSASLLQAEQPQDPQLSTTSWRPHEHRLAAVGPGGARAPSSRALNAATYGHRAARTLRCTSGPVKGNLKPRTQPGGLHCQHESQRRPTHLGLPLPGVASIASLSRPITSGSVRHFGGTAPPVRWRINLPPGQGRGLEA